MRHPAVFFAVIACIATCAPPALARLTTVTDPDLPRSLPVDGPVEVNWTDPGQFSDIRFSTNRTEARRGDWVRMIARYVRKRTGTRLPDGDTLEVTITDIKRAGNYEPWRGISYDDTRIVRDLYPPRIDLRFRLMDRNGSVVSEGERKLTDLAFLTSDTTVGSSDLLRFEKRLIDRWVRKEFDDKAIDRDQRDREASNSARAQELQQADSARS